MNVKEVVSALKKYDSNMDVYIRKEEFFGNVGYVFYVSKATHPILGTDCVVLRDDAPYEVYYEDDYDDEEEALGHCAKCENYEECRGCEECEHVCDREEKHIGDGGCSGRQSNMTVGELIHALSQVDEDADVMTMPRNGNKNFCDVVDTKMDSYAFFGKEIPCVYVTAI